MRVVTGADVCDAAEEILREHLHSTVAQLGWDDELKSIATWDQAPTPDALTRANYPAVAIATPGTVGAPRRKHDGVDATWRLLVGVYDRDVDYTATTRRITRWAAAVRATVTAHPSLGGLATAVTWAGEDYAEKASVQQARTLAGCVVSFDVTVPDVTDLSPGPGDPGHHIVRSTRPRVTVRPLSTEE